MKYILLVDNEQDILNIQSMSISCFYGGEIVMALNSDQALNAIITKGTPELIVSDYRILEEPSPSFYSHLIDHNLAVPLIICSGHLDFEFKQGKYPGVTSFFRKPFSIESLTYLVKGITTLPIERPAYIPVKISVLMDYAGNNFDLYLKLADDNFVKVLNRGEEFTMEDADRFLSKSVNHLYLDTFDSFDFLKMYEENLNNLMSNRQINETDAAILTLESIEVVEVLSKRLGWTQEVIEQAKNRITSALVILEKSLPLSKIIRKKLTNPSSAYSRHVGLQMYLTCILSNDLGWFGESAQMKFALASLMHDLAVSDEYYGDIKEWNRRARDLKDKDPDVVKYRLHPLEASRLVQDLELLPPDVDQILLQHHETKDGKGFPRSLTSSRISQYATFFIIIETLVDFIGDGKNLETSIIDFITWGDNHYDVGNFKKIYEIVRLRLAKF